MRDLFEDIFVDQPTNPMEAARRAMRPAARRRFYSDAAVTEQDGGFAVMLDGKPVRTPARQPLRAPTRALGEAIAAEWQAQPDIIDPARMPLTRLANTILDGVATAREAVAADVARYLGSDLIVYRAEEPDGLVARQGEHWDPIMAWARVALGARLVLTQGVVPLTQPDHALAAATTAIPRNPWRLGAVHAITTLTGSALIALALAAGGIPADAAWAAAHVDEDWNMEHWGRDTLALARRGFRFAEFEAATTVLRTVLAG
jgi:chaperone required for assembly of F1-ATPase